MKRHRSGWSRLVRSRKRPRSGGIVESLAEHVAQGRGLGAGRMRSLERLVELLRVAEQDEVTSRRGDGDRVGERQLPRLVDHEDVDRRGELGPRPQPGGSADDVHLAGSERIEKVPVISVWLGRVGGAIAVRVRLLADRDRDLVGGRPRCDRVEQVADDAMAVGSDADLPAEPDQLDDDLRAEIGLARARRALDGQAVAVQSGRPGASRPRAPSLPAGAGPPRSRLVAAGASAALAPRRDAPGASMPCPATHSPTRSRLSLSDFAST